jgi:hypothetical protein
MPNPPVCDLYAIRYATRDGKRSDVASDVTHFYENMESGWPFTTAVNVGDMLEAFDSLAAHAPTPDHIVPGHDPLVMARYPAASPALAGLAVRLDAAPKT